MAEPAMELARMRAQEEQMRLTQEQFVQPEAEPTPPDAQNAPSVADVQQMVQTSIDNQQDFTVVLWGQFLLIGDVPVEILLERVRDRCRHAR